MLVILLLTLCVVVSGPLLPVCSLSPSPFPSSFLWGSSTAAYQIEGSWNVSKQPSTWDVRCNTPGSSCAANNDTGNVADDSYKRYQEDRQLLTYLNLTAYRFSIAWSRIITLEGQVNQEAIQHYNNVIDDLLQHGITPFVTLYHGDIPYAYDQQPNSPIIHGWGNATQLIPLYLHYVTTCFQYFGDRVKHWITLNEVHQDQPRYFCGDIYPCGHTAILAHAYAVQAYRKLGQGGVIGMVIDGGFAIPLTNSTADVESAQRALVFDLGWLADPLFFGDYPQVMKDRVSRLPVFTDNEKTLLKQNIPDFFGLNTYTSSYTYNDTKGVCGDSGVCSQVTDINGTVIGPRGESPWLYSYPPGIRGILHWVYNRYLVPIYITENGCDAPGESQLTIAHALEDQFRVDYYKGYMNYMTQAVAEGVDLRGYFVWSLLDNFEWGSGYNMRFGMHYVDYTSPVLARYPKRSAQFYSDFVNYQRENPVDTRSANVQREE